jgi:hypothetical protein
MRHCASRMAALRATHGAWHVVCYSNDDDGGGAKIRRPGARRGPLKSICIFGIVRIIACAKCWVPLVHGA